MAGVYCRVLRAIRRKAMGIFRTAVFVLLVATIAAADKTPPTYQKGTIKAWNIRVDSDTSGGSGAIPVTTTKRRAKVYELSGGDLVYEMDYCRAFHAGEIAEGP